ncbi:MAG: type II toxin-antitoxin system RelE/ParE family toxin [Bacteroidetes bacterium]|nr:type II toxin-antitoxin system RelE/ParE family toxin [Bacteroidota bacterium]
MAYQVVWSPEAMKTFDKIVDYREEYFSENEVARFVQLVNRRLLLLKKFPELGRKNRSPLAEEELFCIKELYFITAFTPEIKKSGCFLFLIPVKIHRNGSFKKFLPIPSKNKQYMSVCCHLPVPRCW